MFSFDLLPILRHCADTQSPTALIAPDPSAYTFAENLNELQRRLADLCVFIQENFADCDHEVIDYACYIAGTIKEIVEDAKEVND